MQTLALRYFCPSLALMAVLTACSSQSDSPDAGQADADPKACDNTFIGDPSRDPELAILVKVGLGIDDPVYEIEDGATVPLIKPPQGGRVIFVGARATNISPCAVQLKGVVRDPVSQQIRLDGRTVNLKPTGDGWCATNPTDVASFSNVNTCPNQWATQDIYDQPYELTVSLKTKDGKKASKTIRVTPTCSQPDAPDQAYHTECLCICAHEYGLGTLCEGLGGGTGGGGAGGSGG